jgi:hypothetical protein
MKCFFGKFFIGHKKTCDFLLAIKNSTFLLGIGLKFYFLLIILVLNLEKKITFTPDNNFVTNNPISHII